MQTELSYVREKLAAAPRSEWRLIEAKHKISGRTLSRIINPRALKKAPRSDTVGKIALWFKTKEERAK